MRTYIKKTICDIHGNKNMSCSTDKRNGKKYYRCRICNAERVLASYYKEWTPPAPNKTIKRGNNYGYKLNLPCACGCGEIIEFSHHKNTKYIKGHQKRGVPTQHSRETLRKIGMSLRGQLVGDKNPAWKGGVSAINRLLRQRHEYGEWRLSVFERDNYTCQDCGVRGGELHAHHIMPFCKYIELRTDINNGTTLCKKCHRAPGRHNIKEEVCQN